MRNLQIISVSCGKINPNFTDFVFKHDESAAVALENKLATLLVADVFGSHLDDRERKVVVVVLVVGVGVGVYKTDGFLERAWLYFKLCQCVESQEYSNNGDYDFFHKESF